MVVGKKCIKKNFGAERKVLRYQRETGCRKAATVQPHLQRSYRQTLTLRVLRSPYKPLKRSTFQTSGLGTVDTQVREIPTCQQPPSKHRS